MAKVSPREVYLALKESITLAAKARMEHDKVAEGEGEVRKYVEGILDELARNSAQSVLNLLPSGDIGEEPERLITSNEKISGIGRLLRSDGRGLELGLMDIVMVIGALRGNHTAHTGPLLARALEDFYGTV